MWYAFFMMWSRVPIALLALLVSVGSACRENAQDYAVLENTMWEVSEIEICLPQKKCNRVHLGEGRNFVIFQNRIFYDYACAYYEDDGPPLLGQPGTACPIRAVACRQARNYNIPRTGLLEYKPNPREHFSSMRPRMLHSKYRHEQQKLLLETSYDDGATVITTSTEATPNKWEFREPCYGHSAPHWLH
jgi:hypothetical protein